MAAVLDRIGGALQLGQRRHDRQARRQPPAIEPVGQPVEREVQLRRRAAGAEIADAPDEAGIELSRAD
jgi:hypothetical protein